MYLNIYTVAMYIPYNVHLFVLLHLFFYIYTGEHEAKIVFVSSWPKIHMNEEIFPWNDFFEQITPDSLNLLMKAITVFCTICKTICIIICFN